MSVTFRFIDAETGSFLSEDDSSFTLNSFSDSNSSVFETDSAATALQILRTRDDMFPSWGIPSIKGIDGDIRCVAIKTERMALGHHSPAITVSTELFEVEFNDVVQIDVIGRRGLASLPQTLRKRYVPEDTLDGLEPDKALFVVINRDLTSVDIGDFVIGRSFTEDAIGEVAHIQRLPDEWPAEPGMQGKTDLLLLLLDYRGTNLPYRLMPLSKRSEISTPAYRV